MLLSSLLFFQFSLNLFFCENILIGQTAPLTGVQSFLGLSYSIGLNASLEEANAEGGVASRMLKHILLDDAFDVTQGRANVNKLLDVHRVLMVAGAIGTPISTDPQIMNRIITENVPFVGPFSGSPLLHDPFRRQVINVRASYLDEVLAMALFIVRDLRMQRVALLYQNDFIGASFVAQMTSLIPVGLSLVASGYNSPGLVDVEGAVEALASSAAKPQVILSTMLELPNQKFIRLFFNDPRADPDCIMIFFSLDLTPTFHTDVDPALWKNLLFTSVVPMPDDPSLGVVQHFNRVLLRFAPAATPNQVMLEGYITGRLIVDALRGIPGPNITRELFLSQIYKTRLFIVDDLPIGLYADNHSGCASVLCSCNSGLRNVFIAQLNLNSGLPIFDPLPTFQYPITQCAFDASTLLAPIVFGQLVPKGVEALENVAGDIRDGILAAFEEANAGGAVPRRKYELVQAAYTTDPEAAAAALVNRFPVLSLLGSVVPSTLSFNTTVPRIGTLDVGVACSSPAFDAMDIHVQPSIELELMALVNYAVQESCPLHFRAPDTRTGRSVLYTLMRSIHTLQQTPASSSVYSVVSAVLPGIPSGCLIVIASAADVGAVFKSLGTRPAVNLLTTSAIAMQLMVSANFSCLPQAGKLHFPSLAVDGTSWPVGGKMSEAWRYGFLAAQVAIQGLGHSQFANQKYNTPLQMLSAIYAVKAIAYERVALGPYFGNKCDSPSDQECACNFGAHTVDVLGGGSHAPDAQHLYNMPGCAMTYVPLAVPAGSEGIPWAVVIGAIVGGAAGLTLLLVALAVGRHRSHSTAPKDPHRPFCVVFTDIQASTQLWATLPEEMAAALNTHHKLIRKQIAKYHCYEVKTIGDSFMCAAKSPTQAMQFALAVQTALFEHNWSSSALDGVYQAFANSNLQVRDSPWNGLRVRIGIHYGLGDIQFDPVAKSYDYYGTVVNAAARIESAAHGGQIAISQAVYNAIMDANLPVVCIDLGYQNLRGLAEPLRLYQVLPEGLLASRLFPPLRVDTEVGDPRSPLNPQASLSERSSSSAGDASWAEDHPLVTKGIISSSDLRYNYDIAMTTLRTLLVMQTKRFKDTVLSGLCDRLHVHNYGGEGDHLQRTLHSLVYRVLPATVVDRRVSINQNSIRTASSSKLRGPSPSTGHLSVAPGHRLSSCTSNLQRELPV